MNVTDMTPEHLGKVVAAETDQMLAAQSVYPGMEVKHARTGGDYIVVCTATIEANMVKAVVYRSSVVGTTWVRPLSEFCDGRFVGR